jgi:hypothetical protein
MLGWGGGSGAAHRDAGSLFNGIWKVTLSGDVVSCSGGATRGRLRGSPRLGEIMALKTIISASPARQWCSRSILVPIALTNTE